MRFYIYLLLSFLVFLPKITYAERYSENFYVKIESGLGLLMGKNIFNINNSDKKYESSLWNIYLPKIYMGYNINENFSTGLFISHLVTMGEPMFQCNANFSDGLNSKYASSYLNLDIKNIIPNTNKYKTLNAEFTNTNATKILFDLKHLSIAPYISNYIFLSENIAVSLSAYIGFSMLYEISSSVNFDLQKLYEKISKDTTLLQEFNDYMEDSKIHRERKISNENTRSSITIDEHSKEEILNYIYNQFSQKDEKKDKTRDFGKNIFIKTNFKNKFLPSGGLDANINWNFYEAWEATLGFNFQFLGNISNLEIDNILESKLNTQKIFWSMQNNNHKILSNQTNYLMSAGISLGIRFNFL
ncbi:MAG: hypothetical protein ISN64_00615 [Rickettsia sp.]|nr:hypothetical protein [Rickettsia sp.]